MLTGLQSLRFTTSPQFYRCVPGWKWSPPPLPDYDLWYVVEGLGQMRLEDLVIPITPGRCFVLQPGAKPVATQDPIQRLLVFAVHFEIDTVLSFPTEGQIVRDNTFFVMLASHCANYFQKEGKVGLFQSHLLGQQMLLQLYDELLHPAKRPLDQNIHSLVQQIRQEPGQIPPVEELAQKFGLSPAQFTRRFRAATGLAPGQFIIRARLERARQLLRETDMSVGQIAQALGYSDIYFFSRQFKEYAGYSPTQIRNQSFQAERGA